MTVATKGTCILLIDGERATGTITGHPNALGVVRVTVGGTSYERPARTLTPVDQGARELLAGGDRFVTRDVDAVIEKAVAVKREAVREWTIADLELLRAHIAARIIEAAAGQRHGTGRQRKAATTEFARLTIAIGSVKQWVKDARMEKNASEAGLTDEERRDPNALLRAAEQEIRKLTTALHSLTGDYQERSKALANAINCYLAHYANAPDTTKLPPLPKR